MTAITGSRFGSFADGNRYKPPNHKVSRGNGKRFGVVPMTLYAAVRPTDKQGLTSEKVTKDNNK